MVNKNQPTELRETVWVQKFCDHDDMIYYTWLPDPVVKESPD